jgi:uncharacterized damage-inducible protein DinB
MESVVKSTVLSFVLLAVAGHANTASPQEGPSSGPGAASQVIQRLIASSEKQITGVATEMPEDKYAFAPTAGEFRGVRTFLKQVKHAAAVNHLVALSILGEPITADMSDERGPDSVKTKAEALKYLAESFAALTRAAATIDEKNAFASIKGVFGSAPDTRMGLIAAALAHSSNHYGQMVEYLRMNGLVPPGSR